MVSLRILTPEDIYQALDLSQTEQWNQTESDWEFMITTPENVCLAAVIDKQIVGTATATIYNNEVAWIGMVLVNKAFRGRGISKVLLSGLIEKLKHCRSIKLDATPAGQQVYNKLGFKNEYKIIRMTCSSVAIRELSLGENHTIEQISNNNINEVIKYDNKVFGANRQKLVEFLLKINQENSWLLKREGKLTGITLGRKGTHFYQIGPVFSSSTDDAKNLILKSLKKMEGLSVVVDVLEDNIGLVSWLSLLGFTTQRPFFRMYHYKNLNPGIPKNQFLICGPEFG